MANGTTEDIVKKLIAATRTHAVREKIIDADTLRLYEAALAEAGRYHEKPDPAVLKEVLKRTELPTSKLLAIAQLMDLEILVLNGIQNYDHASEIATPRERFINLLNDTLYPDGKTLNRQAFARLQKNIPNMVISFVHTAHPVVYHTWDARELERKITDSLETFHETGEKDLEVRLHAISDEIGKFTHAMMVNEEEEDKKPEAERIKKVAITPLRQVTISEETAMERENLAKIKGHIAYVIEEWNRAVSAFAEDRNLPEARQLVLSREQRDAMFELRLWGRAADADGRTKASSSSLFANIMQDVKDGQYAGDIFDPRQNARVHRDAVSALIQARYRDSAPSNANFPSMDDFKFQRFCDDFLKEVHFDRDKQPDKRRTSRDLIYQELGEHKEAFMKKLICSDIYLVPKEFKEYTRAFNQIYQNHFADFIRDKNEERRIGKIKNRSGQFLREPLPIDISLDDLANQPSAMKGRSLLQEWADRIAGYPFSITIDGKPEVFHLKLSTTGNYFEPVEHFVGHDYLLNTKKLVKTDATKEEIARGEKPAFKKVSVKDDERPILMDVAKRMQVLNDTIKEYGPGVANRYQIANFSESAHFFEMMLLMKETGLLKMKGDKVSEAPRVAIMPLIETDVDMDRAPEIFRHLLEDPLSRSYYKACGDTAHFMMGFSDGAKSTGVFASLYKIFETQKKLAAIAEEYGVKIRFLEGRGRGTDRGGMIELGAARKTVPDIVNQHGVCDVTLQADEPMHMAISKSYGRDQIASQMIGMISAQEEALSRSDNDKDRLERLEQGIKWIADETQRVFKQNIYARQEIIDFVMAMPKNAKITSRSLVRPNTAKAGKANEKPRSAEEQRAILEETYDGIRAITYEYAAEFADFLIHQVGLITALKKFEATNPVPVRDSEGRKVYGKDALRTLLDHPFFHTVMNQIYVGTENYDINVARLYGAKLNELAVNKRTDFVKLIESVHGHIDGLEDYIKALLPAEDVALIHSPEESQHKLLGAHDTLMHALSVKLPKFSMDEEEERELSQLKDHISFGLAAKVSHHAPTLGLRKAPEPHAGMRR